MWAIKGCTPLQQKAISERTRAIETRQEKDGDQELTKSWDVRATSGEQHSVAQSRYRNALLQGKPLLTSCLPVCHSSHPFLGILYGLPRSHSHPRHFPFPAPSPTLVSSQPSYVSVIQPSAVSRSPHKLPTASFLSQNDSQLLPANKHLIHTLVSFILMLIFLIQKTIVQFPVQFPFIPLLVFTVFLTMPLLLANTYLWFFPIVDVFFIIIHLLKWSIHSFGNLLSMCLLYCILNRGMVQNIHDSKAYFLDWDIYWDISPPNYFCCEYLCKYSLHLFYCFATLSSVESMFFLSLITMLKKNFLK